MALVRLLTSRVVAQGGDYVSQTAGQVIQVGDELAARMVADRAAELVDGEALDLPTKPVKAEAAVTPPASQAPPAVQPAAIAPAAQPIGPPSGASIDVLGLGDKIVEALTAAGIETLGQLDAVEDLTSIEGIGLITAEKIIAARKKVASGSTTPEGND